MIYIKKFRRHKMYQLLITGIIAVGLFYIEKEYFSFIALISGLISIAFSKTLLYEIELKNSSIIFKTYSLFYGKEELVIPKKDFIVINHISEEVFSNDGIEVTFRGEYAPLKKEFHINAAPWDDLNEKLTSLKNWSLENSKAESLNNKTA